MPASLISLVASSAADLASNKFFLAASTPDLFANALL